MPTWAPIVTAPKDGTPVLTYRYGKYGAMYAVAWNKGRGWHTDPGIWRIEPTHWIAIAKPPKYP